MKNGIKLFAFTLAVAVAGGISSLIIYKIVEKPKVITIKEDVYDNNLLTNNKLDASKHTNLEIAAQMTVNAVVHVKTEVMVDRPADPFYQFFYGGQPEQQMVQSAGSGVIISEDGYIVTNNHVIENAENVSVTLNNKRTYDAEVIGNDPTTDLALLKINKESLPFVKFGNSDDVNIGQWVLAVGNPFNLTSTVTAGIVSAKGRDINILRNDPYNGTSAIESFIQTDAAVNPGNSGGALVASTGELIGINSAIKSNTGSYTGYSFAIPANIVKKVVTDLKEFGVVQRAFIGVSINDITDELAQEIGIDDLNGVYINGTTKNGSAAKSGIESGDIIKKIGNKKINNVAELQEQISQYRPGDKVTVVISRNGELIRKDIVLKNLNGSEEVVANQSNEILKLLGAKFVEPSPKELKRLNINNGIKIDELYSGKLRKIGVREGYIITSINQQKIEDINDLISTVKNSSGGILIEGIYENGRKEFYGFGV